MTGERRLRLPTKPLLEATIVITISVSGLLFQLPGGRRRATVILRGYEALPAVFDGAR